MTLSHTSMTSIGHLAISIVVFSIGQRLDQLQFFLLLLLVPDLELQPVFDDPLDDVFGGHGVVRVYDLEDALLLGGRVRVRAVPVGRDVRGPVADHADTEVRH